jgi:asparagine synthase (glutamine-hydrolysing)
LLGRYLDDGIGACAGIEGRFAAAIWDKARRELLLISDKFGAKPLYYSQHPNFLAFASEIKALLGLPDLSRNLNLTGLVQFFAFGHFWNGDTLLSSVHCMDAASVRIYDDVGAYVRHDRYWRPRPNGRRTPAESLDAIDARLKTAVDERASDTPGLGISLSGGLDARTLLGVMDPATAAPIAISLGMEGSIDRVSGQRLAELAGSPYHPVVLGKEFLTDFDRHLHRMIELTDGQYLSQCIVMPTLPVYAELGVRVLLRGHAGELLHMRKAYNFSVDAQGASTRNEEQLIGWLFPRLQRHLTAGLDETILCGVSRGDFESLSRQVLLSALQKISHWDHPVDTISQLFLDQRTRRETAVSLVKFQSVVDCRLPYLDGRVIDEVFSAPPELRLSDQIQTYILRKRRPSFLRPANSNTGAPVGAGRLRRKYCQLKMRILAKLGARGFQPYERLGLWLRRELRPYVEATLLDERCLDRGLLEPRAVARVVRRHSSGERNHTFLLMAMMILELGCRRFLDGDASPKDREQGALFGACDGAKAQKIR